MNSDLDLIRRFVRDNSHDAFAEIVRRHLDLVYSAALRQVRSPHLAEEVAQSVFADLARQAGRLKRDTVLTAWLYAVTRRTAIDVIRQESRRRLREQIAVEMNDMNATADEWTRIAPLLDDAMAELDEIDRTAVLLRFFENKSLRDVGAALGTGEDAAQKRVSRAVERLRAIFSKQNVTVSAAGLAVLISTNAVKAAPVGLSATMLTATGGATTTLGMAMIHKLLITGLVAAIAGTGIYIVRLRGQSSLLQQQQAALARQINQLDRERDDATKRLAEMQLLNEQLSSNTELLRLRGEVAQLRQSSTQATPVIPVPAKTNRPVTVRIGTKLVTLPTADLEMLGINWVPGAQGRFGLLGKDRMAVINEALRGASDANVLSSPTVITINGEAAEVEVSRAVQVTSTNYNAGIRMRVDPTYSSRSSTFDMSVSAEFREFAGDPSRPEPQSIVFSNRFNLSPGQTAIFENEIQSRSWAPGFFTNSADEPHSLVVFITPSVVDSRAYERPGKQPGTVQRTAVIWKSPTNADALIFQPIVKPPGSIVIIRPQTAAKFFLALL